MIINSVVLENEDDRSYIKALYQKYYPIMRRTVSGMVENPDIVDDLIDNTMIKLIRNLDTVRGLEDKAQIVYIVFAVKNKTVDYIRTAHHCEYWESFDGFPDPTASFGQKCEQKIDMENILFMLNGRDRQLLFYRYYLDMPLRQIGKEMGIKEKQVGVYLQNARKRALQLIQRTEG